MIPSSANDVALRNAELAAQDLHFTEATGALPSPPLDAFIPLHPELASRDQCSIRIARKKRTS